MTGVHIIPCILDCQSLVAPTLHPFHHPSRPVSWHLDLECALACPSPLVLYHLDHQFSHVHPNHLASLHQDPVSVNLYRLSVKPWSHTFYLLFDVHQIHLHCTEDKFLDTLYVTML